jgi:polysaccharide biosynthesis/export protein
MIRVFAASLVLLVTLRGVLAGQSTPADHTTGNHSTILPAVSEAQADTGLQSARSDNSFIIGNDDVLAISVWKEADLAKQVPVRSDGKISLPLIGDVQAAGRTPLQLEQEITDRLKAYITNPQVTVIVQEIHSLKFNILGEVNKPGAYSLTAGTTIVDAIAIAGGFKDFAKKKGIYVLRLNATGAEIRYEFNYQDFIKGKNIKQNILLRPHDTIVVP